MRLPCHLLAKVGRNGPDGWLLQKMVVVVREVPVLTVIRMVVWRRGHLMRRKSQVYTLRGCHHVVPVGMLLSGKHRHAVRGGHKANWVSRVDTGSMKVGVLSGEGSELCLVNILKINRETESIRSGYMLFPFSREGRGGHWNTVQDSNNVPQDNADVLVSF